MKVLRVLLVLAGVACLAVGAVLYVAYSDAEECTFPCSGGEVFERSLAPALWAIIGLVLFMLVGILAWMEKRFEQLSI